MDESLKEFLASAEKDALTIEDPALHQMAFTIVVAERKKSKEESLLERICSEEFNQLSLRIDLSEIQYAVSVRNVLFSRTLASVLIDEEGKLILDLVDKAISSLSEHLYSLGPNRHLDCVRYEHVLCMLKEIKNNKNLQKLLHKVDKPYQNKNADDLIRFTLLLDHQKSITDVDAKRAVLAALFTFLRQSVGSCFATACGMIVHSEQPEQFVKDILELLGTGQLKRTFEGREYTVPLSVSFGAGDLRRTVILAREVKRSLCPLWHSPGFIEALEVVKIIDPTLHLGKKREILLQLLEKAVLLFQPVEEYFAVTLEDLLKALLLVDLSLTESDVRDYLDRPHAMIHSSLLMQVTSSKKALAVGERVNHYLFQFEEAKKAFVALADNALLKSWEFTLASFTEMKANFSTWNLYTSLGFSAHDKGGLGEKLYQMIRQKLDEENRKIEEYQRHYEELYTHLKYLEGRLKRARDEKEAMWLKPEYQSRVNEFNTFEEMRNKANYRAESFANLFDVLIHMYMQLFPVYFQEVYDADMHHYETGIYDDSPAGFQLLYKHGRASTSAWTSIKSLQEYVSALQSFFSTTEHEIINDPVMAGFERDLSEFISAFISYVKTDEFLESALYRMAASKGGRLPQKPLENLQDVEKKPWAYTSGGSLETLVQTYFRLSKPPTYEGRWVENPTELLVFIVDTLKALPEKIQKTFLQDSNCSLLMTSPTHAFVIKPGIPKLKEAWTDSAYTYIWCRDHWIEPMKKRVEEMNLYGESIEFLVDKLKKKVPFQLQATFGENMKTLPRYLPLSQLSHFLEEKLEKSSALLSFFRSIEGRELLGKELVKHLPLFPREELKKKVTLVVEGLVELRKEEKEKLFEIFDLIEYKVVKDRVCSAEGVRHLLKILLLFTLKKTSLPVNFHKRIEEELRKNRLSYPEPILFADTNWVTDYFAFVVSPLSEELEFWRYDPTGTYGTPLLEWKKWLDGSRKTPFWEIYNKREEYTVHLNGKQLGIQ